ncbi:MAG: glycolate oxidase subunit GlcE [Herminiimonas sp.]|nr:glycolate oxidase subunit GlcE [Herminiimonas sp.]
MEHALARFKEQILTAGATGQALCIRGGGSKDWYGQAPVAAVPGNVLGTVRSTVLGTMLDTRPYAGIIDYEPTELVITARCGTPLAEIEAALAAQNQMLAFEPPHFGPGATIGGVVAAGLSGPARASVGAIRDFVLGAVLMDGKGEVLHFGGQVMKNVAGYDVSRLLTGSLGTLGLLLEVSVKVLPKAVAQATVRQPMAQADAIVHLNKLGGQPLPIAASVWQDGVLTVRLAGAKAAVVAAQARVGGGRLDEAEADGFWLAVREQTTPFFAADAGAPLWRLSVPSTAAPIGLAGSQLIEWGGAQRWLRSSEPAGVIRAAATAAGGHATLFRGGDKSVGVFQPLAPAVQAIHRQLKHAFDPQAIFNPGRMYPVL